MPEDPFSTEIIEEIEIEGEVVDHFNSNFCPRSFTIDTGLNLYRIATYFWIYQSCVVNGMKLKVRGNLRRNNTITIDNFSQGIRVLQ